MKAAALFSYLEMKKSHLLFIGQVEHSGFVLQ